MPAPITPVRKQTRARACSEFWRIMDCAADFSWAVFYYAGAASAAGITYRGALICTPSGHLPADSDANRAIDDALRRCGVRRWEMFNVDNDECDGAPLSVPDSGDTALREAAVPA